MKSLETFDQETAALLGEQRIKCLDILKISDDVIQKYGQSKHWT